MDDNRWVDYKHTKLVLADNSRKVKIQTGFPHSRPVLRKWK